MGTRHLIIVYYKGEYRIAQYGQWDGYPAGQGRDVLDFARDPELIAKLAAALDAGMVYDPTLEEVEDVLEKAVELMETLDDKLRERPNGPTSSVGLPLGSHPVDIVCPSLSRDSGAKILKLVTETTEPIPLVNDLDFITDGLFCEWAWLLDLDKRALECWRGGGGSSSVDVRFDHLEDIESGTGDRPRMVASFPLDNLPDELTFLKECGEPALACRGGK